MFESDEIFRKSVLTAGNHIKRAREGANLLAEGKSLSEMETPISGLTEGEMTRRRQAQLKKFQEMGEADLRQTLGYIELMIERALGREIQGTSELYWERIVILDILEKNIKLS